MQIIKESQLEIGTTYYYADIDNPKLEHQADGVYVCSCIWKNIAAEYREKYGFGKSKMMSFSTDNIILFVGRNNYNNKTNTYMEAGWIQNKKFFTTLEEAYKNAVVLTFEDYYPYH